MVRKASIGIEHERGGDRLLAHAARSTHKKSHSYALKIDLRLWSFLPPHSFHTIAFLRTSFINRAMSWIKDFIHQPYHYILKGHLKVHIFFHRVKPLMLDLIALNESEKQFLIPLSLLWACKCK